MVSHRIHVWYIYIYLHLVDFYGKCRQTYHTWILWVSKWLVNGLFHFLINGVIMIIGVKKTLIRSPLNPALPTGTSKHPTVGEGFFALKQLVWWIFPLHWHPRRFTFWTWTWWFGRLCSSSQECILRFHVNLSGCSWNICETTWKSAQGNTSNKWLKPPLLL